MKAACAGLALLLLTAGGWAEEAYEEAAEAAAEGPKVSGYVKNLLVGSRTVVGADERYALDLTRLRVELKGPIAPHLTIDLQVDNELLLGDYLRTQQFRMQKEGPVPTWWNAQFDWLDSRRAHGQANLHRGFINASFGDTDLRVGRQRIAWGTGRFWSPLDILNPVSPTALERAERIGVDAVLVEHKLGAVSRAAFAYAPQHAGRDASAAGMWHSNRGGVDYSVVAGRFARNKVIGIDLAGQLGAAGVRGELTRTAPDDGPGYVRALLAIDYAFANTLTLSGELFYDGSGTRDRRRYDFAALLSGRRQSVAQHYLGVSASYELTPLLKTRHDVILNLDDGSRFYSPSLVYSIRTDLDVTFGAQLVGGARGTEFRALRRLLYAQMQWFF